MALEEEDALGPPCFGPRIRDEPFPKGFSLPRFTPKYNGSVKPGELILVDAGVEAESLYTADLTRTLPVTGSYTDVQRRIYQAVLDAADSLDAHMQDTVDAGGGLCDPDMVRHIVARLDNPAVARADRRRAVPQPLADPLRRDRGQRGLPRLRRLPAAVQRLVGVDQLHLAAEGLRTLEHRERRRDVVLAGGEVEDRHLHLL